MRDTPVRTLVRAALGAGVILSIVSASALPASAAGYPRRVAIAPFASLAKEDIGATVAVLPRLLASRLMALAGAEVMLLPAGGKSPEVAAKEAKFPLLLQGTVSKLGKGYSIDTTVTDLSTGGSAGAFFATAATEDDIIAQLGTLSGEIAEKVFGVQGAVRAVSPVPAAAPAPSPAAVAVVGGIPVAASAAAQAPAGASPAAGPVASAEGWIPSSLKKTGQSDKIVDEIHGVVSGDTDEEGNGEVVAWGSRTIYVYRIKGSEILPYTRIPRGLSFQVLNVEAIDLNGDGKKDLLVTFREGDTLYSTVFLRKGDVFDEIPAKIPYFLVVLPDWEGKRVIAGQARGVEFPFHGKIFAMQWDGKTVVPGPALPPDTNILPLSAGGIAGLSSARFGKEWRWLYTDENEYMRVMEAGGKSLYKSKEKFGAASNGFEYGPLDPMLNRKPRMEMRRAPRPLPGPEGAPLVLAIEVKRGIASRAIGSFDTTRLVVFQWDGSEFVEKGGSPKSDFFFSGADLLSSPGLRKGGKVISALIEKFDSAMTRPESRLVLLQME